VAQEHLTPFGGAAFDFEHLAELEGFEARVREVEREGDGGGAGGGEPFVAEVAIGAEGDAAEGEFVVELAEAGLEFGAFDANAEVAYAEGEEFLVFERDPSWRSGGGCGRRRRGREGGGLRRDFHFFIVTLRAGGWRCGLAAGFKTRRARRRTPIDTEGYGRAVE